MSGARQAAWLAAAALVGACGGGGPSGEAITRPAPSCRFEGTWTGVFDQPDFGKPYPITVEIADASPALGAPFATVTYPSLGCGGTWARTGDVTTMGTLFTVTETISDGCVDGCEYELILDGDACTIRGAGASCPDQPRAIIEAWSFALRRR